MKFVKWGKEKRLLTGPATKKEELNLEQVSLVDLLEEALGSGRSLAETKQVRLSCNSFHSFPPMLLDRQQMIRAFRALVESIVEMVPGESGVDLLLAGREGAAELVINWPGELECSELLPDLAAEIIQSHGGSVSPASIDGQCSLTITVPVVRPAMQIDALDTGLHDRDAASHLRILLAEDSPMNRKLTSSLLEKKGHSVTRVANGHEAVNAYVVGHFDLVLMDLQMPGMDGLEAAETIRRLDSGRGRHVPIIALTASDIEVSLQRCLDAGMDLMLGKPFKMDEFELLLKHLRTVDLQSRLTQPPGRKSSTP